MTIVENSPVTRGRFRVTGEIISKIKSVVDLPPRGGSCTGLDPNIFYPESGYSGHPAIKEAVKICNTCEIKEACLNYALRNREILGIWGGTTGRQRRKMWSTGYTRSYKSTAECGTNSGYYRHLRRDEIICNSCRQAHNLYERIRTEMKKNKELLK